MYVLSISLSLHISVFVSIYIYICICIYLELFIRLLLYLHLHQGPNRQHATKRLPPSHYDLVPSIFEVKEHGKAPPPARGAQPGDQSFRLTKSVLLRSLALIYAIAFKAQRTIHTLVDYITAGLKPENDGGSFGSDDVFFFFPDFNFLVFFFGEPAVHFPGSTFEKRKEFVSVVFTHLLGSLQGKSSFGNG